jgi:hypothetical protein
MKQDQNNKPAKPPVADGCLTNAAHLMAQGVTRSRLSNWIRSGELVAETRGVYRRSGSPLKWQAVAYSLSQMGCQLMTGGLTALDTHGLSHYLHMGKSPVIHFYGPDKPPMWLRHIVTAEKAVFQFHYPLIPENDLPSEAITSMPWGTWDWQLRLSSPELALLEVLNDVPKEVSFDHADKLFQGMVNIRPQLMEELLQKCKNIKVKRLFFWFAGRHNHAWFQDLDSSRFDLGKGKRMLAKGGKFDKKYLITVPEEFHGSK